MAKTLDNVTARGCMISNVTVDFGFGVNATDWGPLRRAPLITLIG